MVQWVDCVWGAGVVMWYVWVREVYEEKERERKRIEEMKQSYENQLNEQKKQVEYFKNLYEEEKSERIRANAQYQTYLLGTAEDNKKRWWQFWNRNSIVKE